MKTKRINKSTRIAKKQIKTVEVKQDYIDTLKGRTVVLKSIPTNIKRAKRLFKVNEKYIIQKPKGNYINSGMSIHLKGSDDKIYEVAFMHYNLIAN